MMSIVDHVAIRVEILKIAGRYSLEKEFIKFFYINLYRFNHVVPIYQSC